MKDKRPFTDTSLGRHKTSGGTRAFFSKIFMKPSSTGLVEDRVGSTTIVRVIIGLLLLHLVIIGGVLVKGQFDKGKSGVAVEPSLTPPPPAATTQDDVLPQPTATKTTTSTASSVPHITQTPTTFADDEAAEELFPEEETVAPAPAKPQVAASTKTRTPAAQTQQPAVAQQPAATQPAAGVAHVRHLVRSGETWAGVARKYGSTVAAIKGANPKAAAKSYLIQGTYLAVPVAADSEAAKAAAASAPPAPMAKTYTVQKGDTLARIAKKHKMSLNKLMQINGLTDKDARRLRPGQKLKVAE